MRTSWPWLLLPTLAIVIRLAVLFSFPENARQDIDSYLLLSQNLASHGTFGFLDGGSATPTAHRPPLFPLMLMALTSLGTASVSVVQLALSGATTLLVWMIGRRIGLGRWSYCAAFLVIADPLHVYYSTFPMTEIAAGFWIALGVFFIATPAGEPTSRRLIVAAAIAFGLGALTRTTVWACAGLLFVFGLGGRRRLSDRCWFLMGFLAIQVPWILRNVFAFGHLIVTTTHGGYTLHLAHNQVYYDKVIRDTWYEPWSGASLNAWQQSLQRAANRAGVVGEVEFDRFCYARSRATIRSSPSVFLASMGVRFWNLWRPFPHGPPAYPRSIQFVTGPYYLLLFSLAIYGLTQRKLLAQTWVVTVACIVALTVVHLFFWSNMRMRAPLTPLLALLASVGIHAIVNRKRPGAAERPS